MLVKITWTPGSGATTQTVQYRVAGNPDGIWTSYSPSFNNTISSATINIPTGSYEFRIINDCPSCTCSQGSTPDGNGGCVTTTTVPATQNTTPTQVTRTPLSVYGSSGTAVHTAQLNPQVYTTLSFSNPFWLRQAIPDFNNLTPQQKQAADLNNGPVNRLAIWGVQLDPNGVPYNNYTIGYASLPPTNTWIGFDVCINIQTTKTYYVGIAADNGYRLILDGQLLLEDDRDSPEVFNFLHIYPVTISAGSHILRLQAINYLGNAGFGCEIFDLGDIDSSLVVQFLNQQTNYDNLNVIFTTRNVTQFTSNLYTCPAGYNQVNPSCTQVICSQTSTVPCTPKVNYSNTATVTGTCPPPVYNFFTLSTPSLD